MAALLVALALSCPHDSSLGTVRFDRGGNRHVVSLADCRDRVVGKTPRQSPAPVPGVVVRRHALWLRRTRRLTRLTDPLPSDQWPEPLALSPAGRYVLWEQAIRSASLSADGRPLKITPLAPGGATRVLASFALGYDDYRTWCGDRLVYVAGGGRIARQHKGLMVATALVWRPRPLWRDPKRAFGSVACAPDGRTVAVLSQSASDDANFFHTRWQLWRVGLDGSRRLLDRPPRGWADESPRWGPHGSLFFVRERQGRGTLMLLGSGAIARLGYSLGYYGHHDWPYTPPDPPSIAFLHRGNLVVLDVATRTERIVARHAGTGPVHWSGDGRFVSVGGRVAGGPAFPTDELEWAPTGAMAAYVTTKRGVVVWTADGGSRRAVPDGWGAQTVAWSRDLRLAIGRAVCHVPCGLPTHLGVWVWRAGTLRRVVGPLPARSQVSPMPFAWSGGRVLWWAWPDSGSIAADGVALYANTTRLGVGLMYPDYVAVCGTHVAFVRGTDRYAVHGKSIVLDGRDVSRDRSRSWVSPSCSADGTTLVASASANRRDELMGDEHRAIWRLLPSRRQLTHPPAGWTDENPRLLADGSILFVRTRQVPRGALTVTERGTLELLRGGTLTALADVTFRAGGPANYYGHYGWPWRIATD